MAQSPKTFGTDTLRHRTLMYIHGGLSLYREGTSVAPPTRRTVHRTRTHAGPSHARRHAEHGALFFCAAVLVEVEREPVEVFRPRQPGARRLARRPRARGSSGRSPSPQREAKAKWSARAWCGVGRGPARVFARPRTCELRGGTEGASRWVWRGGSSVRPRTFAARQKITSTGATSP